MSQVPQVPYPFPFATMASALPYLFAAQPGQQQGVNQQFALPGQMGQMSQMDLACFIALQQQLNSQAQAASVLPGIPAGLPAAYAMQFGQQAMNAQALQFLPQGAAAGGMYPYGNAPFGFSAAGPAQTHYATATPTPAPQSHSHTPAPAPVPQAQAAMTATPPASSSPAQGQAHGQSLYPSLPQSLYGQQQQQQQQQQTGGYNPHQSLAHQQQQAAPAHHAHAPAVKVEDLPSPANSARSHHSTYSSSLSPGNVPALSPPSSLTPENSFSPSPVPEHDAQRHGRASYSHGSGSTTSVAGKKRGFEEATGQFLGALANKRFQDAESVGAQLDSLSSFLLTPDLSAHALTPPGLGDDSGSGSSSSGSEYGSNSHVFEREEVDTINQLLLSLNQSFETDLAASASAGGLDDVHGALGLDMHGVASSATHEPHHQPQPRPIAGLPSSASFAPSPSSLYPNLTGSIAPPRTAPQPASYPTLPSSMPSYGHAPAAQDPHLRLAKSVAPPTITNDYRPTQYHHVGRLQRAAPSSGPAQSIEEQVEQEMLDADMDVDDDVKDAAAALLMGKSLSRGTPSQTQQKQQLPPLATAMRSSPDLDLRLAPIASRTGSSSRLPPIRDLLALRSPESDLSALDSPTSPVASGSGRAFAFSPSASSASSTTSSASATATSSRASTAPLYPSLSSLAPTSSSRPVSAGGVERLTHRVHKLRLPTDAEHPVRESDADLSASSDEDDDEVDHPSSSKKSRVGDAPHIKEEEDLSLIHI